jgi:hypothetical protein
MAANTCGRVARSASERSRGQFTPARLRTFLRRLGEAFLTEAASRCLLDPRHIRVGTIGQPAYSGTSREQPHGLLVLVFT